MERDIEALIGRLRLAAETGKPECWNMLATSDLYDAAAELEALKAVEPIVYFRAREDGQLVWSENCVSETPDFEEDDDFGNLISLPLYTGPQLPQWRPIDYEEFNVLKADVLVTDGEHVCISRPTIHNAFPIMFGHKKPIAYMPLPPAPQPGTKK